MNDTTTAIDRAAMGLSAALILLGTVVLGFVELLTGEPYYPADVTNDAGEVIASPTIDPTIRTGLVIAGLLVLAAWGLYRLAAPRLQSETDEHVAEVPSD